MLEKLIHRSLFLADAETAHSLAIKALKLGLYIPAPKQSDMRLCVQKAGLNFTNPVGIAAGFDKNGEVPDAILKLGFGFAEVGTITPKPQTGNPKPRIFRLKNHKAVINRLGFNNKGADYTHNHLYARRHNNGLVGVNIGANKDSADRISDYVEGLQRFYDIAGYFTINVSSPNTPGLRDLQAGDELKRLIEAVEKTREVQRTMTGHSIPVLLKIAPDLDLQQLENTILKIKHSSFDGVIVSNTTLDKSQVANHKNGQEIGGLSGPPVFEKSTILLAHTRRLLGDNHLIIGAGGITDPQTAIEKLAAGADVIQVYTGFIYAGPKLATNITRAISGYMDDNNFSCVADITSSKQDKWLAKSL